VAQLFELRREANSAGPERAGTLSSTVMHLFEDALGLSLGGAGGTAEIPPEVTALAAERDEARSARDWGRADAIRDELVAAGWVVEDGPEGTTLRR